MSRNESVDEQLTDDTIVLCGMSNSNFSEGVDQIPSEMSAAGNPTLSNTLLTFSTPISASRYESFTAEPSPDSLINKEKSGINSSPILFNSFDSTDMTFGTPCTAGPSFFSTPMTASGVKYTSKIPRPFLPMPVSSFSRADKNCEKLQLTLDHLISNQQTSTLDSFANDKDPLESTDDILQEAIQILHSLSFDISRSLDDIPKSIALPSVIEKYSRRTIKKSVSQDNLSSRQNCDKDNPSSKQNSDIDNKFSSRQNGDIDKPSLKQNYNIDNPSSRQNGDIDNFSSRQNSMNADISTFISPNEEILQLLSALQCRCLEYRETALDIAESIAKECLADADISVFQVLIARYNALRDDFTNFKKLCFRAKASRTGAESLTSFISDCLQTSYLRLLVEENETFLVRLKLGIYMVRMNARLVRDLKEASMRVSKLEEEVDFVTRTTIGYKV